MEPERWHQLDQLFHSALESKAEEGAGFLDKACSSDDALHKQFEELRSCTTGVKFLGRHVASLYAALGEKAFAWLEKTFRHPAGSS